MKGLILKDLYLMRSYLRTLLFIFIFYMALGYMSGSVGFFGAFMGVMCIMMTISSYSYDQACGWDLYGASLPVSRRSMVRSKYLLALILGAVGITVSICCQLLFALTGKGIPFDEILPGAFGAGVSGTLLVIVLMPCIYRFGVEKGRIVLLALGAGIMAAAFLLMKLGGNGIRITEGQIKATLWSLPFVLLIATLISYRLSCRFFEQKDL